MIISPADHSTGELFTLAKAGKWYTVTPKCAGSWRLNVEGEKSNTNTDVGLWTNTNHSTQGWYFEPVSGVADGYIIRSANNTDCVLDIRGTTTGKGVKIKKYEANNLCQIWIVRAYTPSISLNKTSETLDIGKTVTLSASKRPVNMPVTYSSSSTKIATVNSQGVVTAKAAGTATIYAKCCEKTATCKITVNEKVSAKPSNSTKNTEKGKSKTLSYDKKKIAGLKNQKAIKDNKMCGAFAIAYCRGIYKKDYKSVNKYWVKAGASWSKGKMKKHDAGSFQNELNSAYKQVKAGKPCIIRVKEKKSFAKNPGFHYVTVIGYKNVKNENKVSLSQLIFLDPYDGKVVMGNKRHENPKNRSQYQIITF